MPQIILDNFSSQIAAVQANPFKLPHYLMQGVYPDYAQFNNGVQEEQAFPLAASPAAGTPSGITGIDGNITQLIPSADPTTYSAFGVTDAMHVYSYDTFYDLTQPFGATTGNPTGRLEVFNGKLLLTYNGSQNFYMMDLGTRVWSLSAATFPALGGTHPMKTFLDFCAAVSTSSGTQRIINKITSSWTITTGIDLGTGWSVIDLENYNNKYLAIAASLSQAAGGNIGAGSYTGNYLFLWDGFAGRYNYSIKIPGKFCDFVSIGDTLYVVVQTAPYAFALYYLNGLSLRKIMDFSYSGITTVNKIRQFDDKLVITTNGGPLVVDPTSKRNYFIYGSLFSGTAAATGGANNYLYLTISGGAGLRYFPRTASLYNSFSYTSHYLPVKTRTGRGQVSTVEIWYDKPPIDANDSIATTLTGINSDDPNAPVATLGNVSATLDSIITTNAGNKYTVLDGKGLVFNKLRLYLLSSTSNSGWFSIIRKIIINYD